MEGLGFRGTIMNVSLIDLVQFLCTSRIDAKLRVISEEGEGVICFSDGRIFHAETANNQGKEAFYEIVEWQQGEFRSSSLDDEWRDKVSIKCEWQQLLLEAVRILDERKLGEKLAGVERDEKIVAYCQSCQKRFYVSGAKIPFRKKISLKCPACKKDVEIKREESTQDVFEVEIEKWKFEELEEDPHFFEIVGGALICTEDEELGERVNKILKKEDYEVHVVYRGRDGFFALRHGQFSVVIVDENIDGGRLERNILLHYLQRMPMTIRRKFCVCLLSDTLKTRDVWGAFRLGVDLIVNKNHVDLIGELLHYTTTQLRKFYEPFLEELQILKVE